jgi:hypothetical protein
LLPQLLALLMLDSTDVVPMGCRTGLSLGLGPMLLLGWSRAVPCFVFAAAGLLLWSSACLKTLLLRKDCRESRTLKLLVKGASSCMERLQRQIRQLIGLICDHT